MSDESTVDTRTENATDLLPLAVLAARIPGRGKGGRLTPATLSDWVRQGVVLPGGGRVKLRAIRLGGCWLSSAPWLAEFAEASTAAFGGTKGDVPAAPGPRPPQAVPCAADTDPHGQTL